MTRTASFTMQVSTQCPACHGALHLPGLTESLPCASCHQNVDLPEAVWADWFEPSLVAEALQLEIGEARQITAMGTTTSKYALGNRPPRCQGCQTDTPMERLEAFSAQGGYRCRCGEQITVREAPALAQAIIPGARWVVNEGPMRSTPDRARKPVVLKCSSCAGSLQVDGSNRSVTCQFCSASNYLPDGLWLQLHPAQTVQVFFVVAEITKEAELLLQAEEDAEGVAARDDLSPELMKRLARSGDWEVRRRIAAQPGLDPDELMRLAKDRDSDVREAVATNPRCPAEALAILAQDSSTAVRREVAANPQAPLELLKSLTRDRSYEVRAKVVANPSLPVAGLMPWLGLENDAQVLDAASARSDLPESLLQAWARSDHYKARALVAGHAKTPEPLLLHLARDRDTDVLRALLSREELPAKVILQMAAQEDAQLASLAKLHASYPSAVAARRKRRLLLAGIALSVLLCVGVLTGAAGILAVIAQQLLV